MRIVSALRRRAAPGQALVEFALVLPLLVLLLLGIFDFGRAIYAYTTVNNAAREAARLAIVDQTETHIQDLAAQRAVALGVTAGEVEVDFRQAATPDAADSCDSNVGTDKIYGCVAVVLVPYSYTAATPVIGNLVGTIDITGEARFPIAFNCVDPAPDPPVVCPVGN